MTGRSRQILGRFPAHFDAARPGKQFEAVVDALSSGIDAESAVLARIRRSHRLADADELRDLLLIAALHGIAEAEMEVLFLRWTAAQNAIQALQQAATDADRDNLAEQLIRLWGIDAVAPVLPQYAPAGGGPPDLNAARDRLLRSARQALQRRNMLDGVRARVAGVASIHERGNGTVRSVMEGAANALDLDLAGPIQDSPDYFWHAALAQDRQTLTRPVVKPPTATKPAVEVETPFNPAPEVIGIEENPLERNNTNQVARRHAELFTVTRRGFDRVLLQVHVTGKESRTVGPMVVNRDEGHGIGYALAVPSGLLLVFTEDGRALLDNNDVTSFAYAWKGACFAGSDSRPTDFVFDGASAVFAVATPANALDPGFNFPHAGDSLPMPGIEVGDTRLAFFVQQAYFSGVGGSPPATELVAPRPAVGFLDDSVFAPGPDQTVDEAGFVSLSWLEHRAFCFRVLIPARFRALTPADADGIEIRQRVAQAIDRFRPAAVEARVEFTDDRWVLGQGVIVSGGSGDLISELQSGTVLWTTPKN
jgi:hypothetical protein